MPRKPLAEPSPNFIDSKRVDRTIGDKLIGERIRFLRLQRSMGLAELARQTGLSASFLSQLETGRVIPTLRNLARIALVFNKDMAWFFPAEKNTGYRKLEKSNRVVLTRTQNKNATFLSESMRSLVSDGRFVPCLAEFHPNGENCQFTPKVFPGTEFVYLIEGTLDIVAGDRSSSIEQGDAFWVDATTPRSYRCSGTNTAKAMIVTEPGQ